MSLLFFSGCKSYFAPPSAPPKASPPPPESFFSPLSFSICPHGSPRPKRRRPRAGRDSRELAGPPWIYLLLLHWFHISFQSNEWSQSWVLLAEHKQETGLTCPQLPLMRSLSKREQVYECFIESASLTCIHPFLWVALWYFCLWQHLTPYSQRFPHSL